MWNPKNQPNKQNRNRLTDTENKLVVARGEEGRGWTNQVKGVKRYTLAVIKQKSHRDVMYSMVNIVNNIVITLYGDKW